MSKKLLIMLSITFIFLICLVLGKQFVVLECSNANFKGRNLVLNCMSNNCSIKKEIDEKYILKINQAVCDCKESYKNKVTDLLGNEYNQLLNVISSGKKRIETESQLFFKTEEYLSCKKRLDESKKAYEKDCENEENKKNLHLVLNELSTLNTTLNNRLKATRDEIESAKSRLTKLFNDNKQKLFDIKNQVKNDLKIQILDIFKEYQFVINELRKTNDTSCQTASLDLINSVNVESVFSSFESEYFSSSEQEIVYSKPITNLN